MKEDQDKEVRVRTSVVWKRQGGQPRRRNHSVVAAGPCIFMKKSYRLPSFLLFQFRETNFLSFSWIFLSPAARFKWLTSFPGRRSCRRGWVNYLVIWYRVGYMHISRQYVMREKAGCIFSLTSNTSYQRTDGHTSYRCGDRILGRQ